jgi:ArsR family transcriptional regulator
LASEGGDACCDGIAAPLSRESAERLARLLKAVADPARLQLLSLIRAANDGEACVCDLTEPLGLTQPTVSHHLKVLTEAGLVVKRRRGLWSWYSIDQARLEELAALLR